MKTFRLFSDTNFQTAVMALEAAGFVITRDANAATITVSFPTWQSDDILYDLGAIECS